jgi:hypothetical protein
MLDEIIDKLKSLNEGVQHDKVMIESDIQRNAKSVFLEMLALINEYDFDTREIKIKVAGDYRKIVSIENDLGSYHSTATSFYYKENKWCEVTSNLRTNLTIDRDVDLQHTTSNIVWSKLSRELFTNNETMSKLLNKMFSCFDNQNMLDEKQTMIHHLIANAQKTNDMLKVQDAFDKGVVSVKNGVYIETFSNTAYIDKMTFTKNISGTYTVELSCDGQVKSQSKRASTSNVSRMVCSLLQLAHTIEF